MLTLLLCSHISDFFSLFNEVTSKCSHYWLPSQFVVRLAFCFLALK